MLRRNGDVQHVDGWIVQQFQVAFANAGNGVTSRHPGCVLSITGCNGNGVESGTPVADEMTIVDDKSAAENPDAKILAVGSWWRIAHIFVHHKQILSAVRDPTSKALRGRSAGICHRGSCTYFLLELLDGTVRTFRKLLQDDSQVFLLRSRPVPVIRPATHSAMSPK